jgi:meiosis induction protein kinase IME2/SME1
MKKTFDSFHSCMELREVIFLRTLPGHQHLVPALDIFLDPLTKKLHIAMEYMDGNLYQLMKSRDHKYFDGSSVKSILFQIISGLEHIHAHQFFHRDIKPENILVSTSAPQESGNTFRRYSALVTPPSTPPAYTVKIADFGLARETHSNVPYTTYVSTRWYRAPEVLLRAGEYSAPVDIWAVGAMAVEIATLKPLFPGHNEVDQVWRVCEIMGSPGQWYNKAGSKIGGGEWRDGTKLANKLGFSFPKMAPHSLDTILRQPQWPASLAEFVTWCLMWDPKVRPTSTQALQHDYFRDAVDPLQVRPKSSTRLLGRKQTATPTESKDSLEPTPSLTTKTSSWFRRSLIQREISAPAVTQHPPPAPVAPSTIPTPLHVAPAEGNSNLKVRPNAGKRATWTNGLSSNAAPIPILPSIRPVSPVSHPVSAQATTISRSRMELGRKKSSLSSSANINAQAHRQQAEKTLTGQSGLASPTSSQKESFFSHLRKRARRFSGRYQTPISPSDDLEAGRNGKLFDILPQIPKDDGTDFADLDKALRGVSRTPEYLLQTSAYTGTYAGNSLLKRHHSNGRQTDSFAPGRSHTNLAYDTPDEHDELLDEALKNARNASSTLDTSGLSPYNQHSSSSQLPTLLQNRGGYQSNTNSVYLTPAPSANRTSIHNGHTDYTGMGASKPINIVHARPAAGALDLKPKWPTPPYEESEWASAAAASILNVQNMF